MLILVFMVLVKQLFLIKNKNVLKTADLSFNVTKILAKPLKTNAIVKKLYKPYKNLCCANKTFLVGYKKLNIIVNINGKNIVGFLPCFKNGIIGYYKKNNNFLIKIFNKKINIVSNTKSQISLIYLIKNVSSNYKVNCFGLINNGAFIGFNKHCQTQVFFRFAKVFKICNCSALEISFSVSIKPMQNNKKECNKGKYSIINHKQFCVDVKNNIVKLSGIINIKNLLKIKINTVKKMGDYFILNNTYYVWYNKNNTFVSLTKPSLNYSFNSNVNNFFNVKILTKNNKLNNYLNNVLPNKIYYEFLKNFNFQNFLNWVNTNKTNNNSNVFSYFKFLEYYGVNGVNNNTIYFTQPKFLNKEITLLVNNTKLLSYNFSGKYAVNFNGINYFNVNKLNLKS